MSTQATRGCESSVGGEVLYLAKELSARSWRVLFASTRGGRRECRVAAGDVAQLMAQIAVAKRKLGLRPEARVVSCYQAGGTACSADGRRVARRSRYAIRLWELCWGCATA